MTIRLRYRYRSWIWRKESVIIISLVVLFSYLRFYPSKGSVYSYYNISAEILRDKEADSCSEQIGEGKLDVESTVTAKLNDIFDYKFEPINATLILIVGYMRSGSTLTGDILQQASNSFYVFEPLHDLTEVIKLKKPVKFLDGSERLYDERDLTNIHAEMLYKWFTCNMTNIDYGSLIHNDMFFYSKITRYYYSCHGHRGRPGPISRVKYCLWYLLQSCSTSNIRVFKTIRISMETVEWLLEKLPNLKVIHLLRDPRAMLQSQLNAKLIGSRELDNQANHYCSKMSRDIKTTERLLVKYPGKIKPLSYESLAKNPVNISKKIYKFIGINYTSAIYKYVKRITMFGRNVKCTFCTVRGNSARTAKLWRQLINFKHLPVIDNYCSTVYNKIGYVRVSSESKLRNWTYPLQRDTNFMAHAL